MIFNINQRSKYILRLLLEKKGITSLEELAQINKVSKRSIYNDVCSINEWLLSQGLPLLEIVRGKGVSLSVDSRQKIEDYFDNAVNTHHIFTPEQRVKVIICFMIYSMKPITIKSLMDICQVSRNTSFSDLRVVSDYLRKYNVKLCYGNNTGYFLQGSAIRIRAILIQICIDLKPLYYNGNLGFLNFKHVEEMFKALKEIEKELKVDYIESSVLSLSILTSYLIYLYDENVTDIKMRERLDFYGFADNLSGINEDDAVASEVYELILKKFPHLPHKERLYLCIHLLGTRLSASKDERKKSKESRLVLHFTKQLVDSFERLACVHFESRKMLESALIEHIRASMIRYRFGISIEDTLSYDVMREYPQLFDFTKIVTKQLEEILNLSISDGEVAYLALHFGSHLRSHGVQSYPLRIYVLCIDGIATGNMLKREISSILPSAEILGVVNVDGLAKATEQYDLIVSTTKVKSEKPVIVVAPILRHDDRMRIMTHNVVVDSLHAVAKKTHFAETKGTLSDKLTHNKVKICDENMSWTNSVFFAGKYLIECGSINEGYLNACITHLGKYGNYAFIADDVVLVHASPEDGVNNMDIALSIHNPPVIFNKQRQAKVIFILAPIDQEKHLGIINDIYKIASCSSNINKLHKLCDAVEVIEFLEKILR